VSSSQIVEFVGDSRRRDTSPTNLERVPPHWSRCSPVVQRAGLVSPLVVGGATGRPMPPWVRRRSSSSSATADDVTHLQRTQGRWAGLAGWCRSAASPLGRQTPPPPAPRSRSGPPPTATAAAATHRRCSCRCRHPLPLPSRATRCRHPLPTDAAAVAAAVADATTVGRASPAAWALARCVRPVPTTGCSTCRREFVGDRRVRRRSSTNSCIFDELSGEGREVGEVWGGRRGGALSLLLDAAVRCGRWWWRRVVVAPAPCSSDIGEFVGDRRRTRAFSTNSVGEEEGGGWGGWVGGEGRVGGRGGLVCWCGR